MRVLLLLCLSLATHGRPLASGESDGAAGVADVTGAVARVREEPCGLNDLAGAAFAGDDGPGLVEIDEETRPSTGFSECRAWISSGL